MGESALRGAQGKPAERPSIRALPWARRDGFRHACHPRRYPESWIIAILYESYHQYRQILLDAALCPSPRSLPTRLLRRQVGEETRCRRDQRLNDQGWLEHERAPPKPKQRASPSVSGAATSGTSIWKSPLKTRRRTPDLGRSPWQPGFSPDEETHRSDLRKRKDFSHLIGK